MKRFKEQGISFLQDLANSAKQTLSTADVNEVKALLHSRNSEVRYLATVIAGLYYNPSFEDSLITLLEDWHLLIRVNACDSLSNSSNIDVCKHILPLMRHRHRLERGYAILSYSDIVINSNSPRAHALETIRMQFIREKDPWVRVLGIEALFQLGDNDILEQIYDYLLHDHVDVKRMAIKCSNRFINDLDHVKLSSILTSLRSKEGDPSIISELDSVLAKISFT